MKTFKTQAAQGDMMIRKIDVLPSDAVNTVPTEDGKHILTHSETGHHHAVLDRPGVQHFTGMDTLRSFLVIPDDGQETDVIHLRDSHTHETLRFPGPGVYEIRRQREHDATQGWRAAID